MDKITFTKRYGHDSAWNIAVNGVLTWGYVKRNVLPSKGWESFDTQGNLVSTGSPTRLDAALLYLERAAQG
jgi:hypothetical protein